MRVRGVTLEAGALCPRLSLSTDAGDRVIDLTEEQVAILEAGARLMQRILAAQAVSNGGVLFEDQIRGATAHLTAGAVDLPRRACPADDSGPQSRL